MTQAPERSIQLLTALRAHHAILAASPHISEEGKAKERELVEALDAAIQSMKRGAK